MFRKICYVTGVSLLFVSPAVAQFGVGGGRKKKAATFQELNEQAKQMEDGVGRGLGGLGGLGDLGDLSKLMGELDPKLLEEMANLGPQFDEVMKIMSEMSPEELQKQMLDAMEAMTSEDMMKNVMQNQGDILETLAGTGLVSEEELAKFKTDPEYFEQKIKQSFEQMSQIFGDPDVLKVATESMKTLQDIYKNPEALGEMMTGLFKDFDDDEKIEEVRQMLLSSPDLGNTMLGGMFDDEDMQELLKDPKKWRDSVREGQGLLMNKGAGVGEL